MNVPDHSDIIAAIEAFCARHQFSDTRFGREATGNANLLAELRGGGSPRLSTLHRIRDFMAARDAAESAAA